MFSLEEHIVPNTFHSFMTWKTLPLVVAPPHSPSQGCTEGGEEGVMVATHATKPSCAFIWRDGRGFSWEQEFGKIMIYAVCCCYMEKCWKFNFNGGQIPGNLFRTISVTFLCKPVPATEVSGVSVLQLPPW